MPADPKQYLDCTVDPLIPEIQLYCKNPSAVREDKPLLTSLTTSHDKAVEVSYCSPLVCLKLFLTIVSVTLRKGQADGEAPSEHCCAESAPGSIRVPLSVPGSGTSYTIWRPLSEPPIAQSAGVFPPLPEFAHPGPSCSCRTAMALQGVVALS